jgi:hypothetical protein
MDSRARGLIIEQIHPNYRELVINLNSSFEVWDKLKTTYGLMKVAKIAIAFSEFYEKKLISGESIEAHWDYLEVRRNVLIYPKYGKNEGNSDKD